MHPLQVNGIPQLVQQQLIVRFPFWQTMPVTGFITAHNQHLRMRELLEYFGQAAHELREAAIRFQIARGIGQYLIVQVQCDACHPLRIQDAGFAIQQVMMLIACCCAVRLVPMFLTPGNDAPSLRCVMNTTSLPGRAPR